MLTIPKNRFVRHVHDDMPLVIGVGGPVGSGKNDTCGEVM